MEKEASLPALELLILVTRIGKHHTTMTTVCLQVGRSICHIVDVLLASAYPCTLGSSDNIGPHIVLCHDGLFVSKFAVVPATRNSTSNLGSTLFVIIDIALVNTHQIGKYVEVVGIVVTAINVCLA